MKAGYEYQHINTDIDDVHPKYGADGYAGQFSRPVGAAADAATFNLVDFLVGARNTYGSSTPSSSSCASACTSATCKTTGA